MGTVEVERCVGDTPCYEEALCGTTVYCADDICEPSETCRAGETEVPFCDEESPDCRARISCGRPAYCQSDECSAPSCDAGQTPFTGACPPDRVCEERSSCGETIYCGLECDASRACEGASSDVLDQGPGSCGDFDRAGVVGCFETMACGAWYCLTACLGNDVQVATREECFPGGDCYPSYAERGEIWCTNSGDVCLAEPVCDDGEEQVPLDYECDEWSFCRFVEQCGVTIQCASPAIVVG